MFVELPTDVCIKLVIIVFWYHLISLCYYIFSSVDVQYLLSPHSGAPVAEGRQAEPHTHIRELKETRELIFSCVSWLVVLLVGTYARRRPRRRSRTT